jgi:NAD kinase
MARQPLFAGLVVDELDHPAGTAYVGEEPCYVVNDGGFLRHIPSEQVDRKILEIMRQQIRGNENMLSEQAAKLLGTDDIFSKAMLENQLKNIGKQFDAILEIGIPEDSRAFMGMSGFKVVINVHGEVLRLEQPAATDEGGDNGE